MQKKSLLALMLAAMLLLTSCSLIVKDEAVDQARVILRLGDIVYTKGDVQPRIDQQLAYTQMIYNMYLGQYIDITDPTIVADARTMVIQSLTQEAVIALKARELGLDVLTDDEKAQLEQAVQAVWQDTRDSVAAELALTEDTPAAQREAAIDAACAEAGITLEAVRASEMQRLLDEKLQAHVIRDVTVPEETIQAEFDAKAGEARAAYEADLSSYGAEVLSGAAIYYRPAGYRNVRQILIQFDEGDTALIDAIMDSLDGALERESDWNTILTELGVTDAEALVAQVSVTLAEASAPTATAEVLSLADTLSADLADDVKEAARELAKLRAQQTFYRAQLAAAEQQALARIAPEADEVLAALAAGEDWDVLAAAHNDDPGMMEGSPAALTGYPVCAGFSQFDPAFVDAAMAIPAPGQWSDKIPGGYGYYIIRYESDVQEGPVALDEVRDLLYEGALTAAQDEAYYAAIDQWVAEADVQVDLRPLDD